jgi:hypothetical protein
LYSLNIVSDKRNKDRDGRGTQYVWEIEKMRLKSLSEDLMGRDHLGDLRLDRGIILKFI